MTIKMSMQVVGLKELEQALKELPKELSGKKGGPVKTALMAAALPVLRSAQANAAKRTGRLRGAIKRQRHPNPKFLNEIVGVGVDPGTSREDARGAWYGHFIEFGTVKNPPRPFLRPALEANRKNSVLIYRKRLAIGIEKIAKQVGNENARRVAANVRRFS